MQQHRLALVSMFVLAAIIPFVGADSLQAAEAGFCEECHAAGNCCNPHKVLCVSCGDTKASTAAASPGDGDRLLAGESIRPLFEAAEAGFCEECHAAGNCCNPHKVLCVSCGDEPETLAGLFAIPDACATTTVAALQ